MAAAEPVRVVASGRPGPVSPGRAAARDRGLLVVVWPSVVTWREVPALREALYDAMERPGCDEVRLDARGVEDMDATGVALLVGADRRARAAGISLVVAHGGGPVATVLRRRGVSLATEA